MPGGLLTDLCELNMAVSYLRRGMTGPATFSLFVRRLPPDRGFLIAAGLEDCLRSVRCPSLTGYGLVRSPDRAAFSLATSIWLSISITRPPIQPSRLAYSTRSSSAMGTAAFRWLMR